MASCSFRDVQNLSCFVKILLVPMIWAQTLSICLNLLLEHIKQRGVTLLSVLPQKLAVLLVLVIIQRRAFICIPHVITVDFSLVVFGSFPVLSLRSAEGWERGNDRIQTDPQLSRLGLLKIYIIYAQFNYQINYQIKTNLKDNFKYPAL